MLIYNINLTANIVVILLAFYSLNFINWSIKSTHTRTHTQVFSFLNIMSVKTVKDLRYLRVLLAILLAIIKDSFIILAEYVYLQ